MSKGLILTSRAAVDESLADAKALRDAAGSLADKLENLIAKGYGLSRELTETPIQTEGGSGDEN